MLIPKRVRQTAAYRTIINGEGSNRSEHTEISRNLADLFYIPSLLLAGFLTVIMQDIRYSLVFALPFFIWAGEEWCTMDNDIRYKKTPDFRREYWGRYSHRIPRHRHPLSHSIFPGSIIRVVYGYFIPIVLFLQLGLLYETLGLFSLALLGQVINDIGHLAADGYSQNEWLFGKD